MNLINNRNTIDFDIDKSMLFIWAYIKSRLSHIPLQQNGTDTTLAHVIK